MRVSPCSVGAARPAQPEGSLIDTSNLMGMGLGDPNHSARPPMRPLADVTTFLEAEGPHGWSPTLLQPVGHEPDRAL